MKHVFFLAASDAGAGLTSVSLGMVRALDRQGIRVAFCKPITQNAIPEGGMDPSAMFIEATMQQKPPVPITIQEADDYVRSEKTEDLMERVVEKVSEAGKKADVVVVEGLLPAEGRTFNNRLNRLMAASLGAEVILVTTHDGESPAKFSRRLEVLGRLFGGLENPRLAGCIINKIGPKKAIPSSGVVPIVEAADDRKKPSRDASEEAKAVAERLLAEAPIFRDNRFRLLGAIPVNRHLQSFRTIDVARHLGAVAISAGDMASRRVRSFALCARPAAHIYHVFTPGALIVTPTDREDVISAAALAAINGVALAGLLLTGECELDPDLKSLCRRAWQTGLPVLKVPTGSYQTALDISRMSGEVPQDDLERMNQVMDFIGRNIFADKLKGMCGENLSVRMSPAAFRHQIASLARRAARRIVLPEGDEPRTLHAALACHQRQIANCVLLGKPEEIRRAAAANGIALPDAIEIIDADAVRSRYVAPLIQLRRHRMELSRKDALEALEDNVMLGTVMLALGEFDGLVSGAVHSTANTIRPALQIIKTREGARMVSSVFFMCLPEDVVVYGDCAVVTNPDAEVLADIAIQSAETAVEFGIEPRVALISYSTRESGSGADVDKVRRATELAKAMRPDLPIDGPLQYDAAANAKVAAAKAPNSPVAGKANVFIFPDLNTGNTTYKAVQRSAGVVSIGPVLQGLRKPVNDLSRGASVDDIIYTIAVTAIQSVRSGKTRSRNRPGERQQAAGEKPAKQRTSRRKA